jgi:ABC-type dipeptide/oligopeptide/nickel transport system ATPase subunit
MPAAVFSAHALSKTYRMGEVAVVAMRAIDLEIYEGKFLVLLGRSGTTCSSPSPSSVLVAFSAWRPACGSAA